LLLEDEYPAEYGIAAREENNGVVEGWDLERHLEAVFQQAEIAI
jgi:hypothetical protein